MVVFEGCFLRIEKREGVCGWWRAVRDSVREREFVVEIECVGGGERVCGAMWGVGVGGRNYLGVFQYFPVVQWPK